MSPRSLFYVVLIAGLLPAPLVVNAGLWSEHQLVGIEDSYDDNSPEVAVDPQDRAWIVWMGVDPVGLDYEIYWSRWEEGSGWLPRGTVHPNNFLYDAWPRLNMASDGTAWVIWLRQQTSGTWDLLSTHWNGTVWTPPDTVVAGPGITDHNYYGVAAVDATHCWVVYELNNQVCAKQYEGDHWGSVEQVISGTPGDPRYVDAAAGLDGQPWAVWGEVEGSPNYGSTLRACRRWPDGSWIDTVLVHDPDFGGNWIPAITVDLSGEGWAVWQHDGDCPPPGWLDVFWSRTVGGVWQAPGLASAPETVGCGDDALADIDASYGKPPRAAWSRYPASGSFFYGEPYSAAWDSEAWGSQAPSHVPDLEPPVEDARVRVAQGPYSPYSRTWATWKRRGGGGGYWDVYASQLLIDVVELHVGRTLPGVSVEWRLEGSAPRGTYLFAVMRAAEGADTTIVGDRFYGSGDEYMVMDETADPESRYSYWVEVLDPNVRLDPPMGTFLFATNPRTVEPLTVSVRERPWGKIIALTARPNPSGRNVEFSAAMPRGSYEVEVFDVQGRRVWRSGRIRTSDASVPAVTWPARETLLHPGGVYWARLRNDEGGVLATTKVVLVP